MAMTGGTAKLLKETTPFTNKSKTVQLYAYYSISQDTAANKSTISCGMYVVTPSGYDIGAWGDKSGSYIGTSALTFDGTIPNFSGTRWIAENKKFTVSHNADGTGSATIAWKWGVNSPWGGYVNPSGSFTIGLPTIPRATTPQCGTLTLGTKATIYISPASSSFTHDISCTVAGSTYTVATGAKGNVQWTPPYAIASRITGTSTKGTVTCKTYSGSSLVGTKSVQVDVIVPENSTTRPVLDTCLIQPYGTIPTAFSGLYIQGKTQVRAYFHATSAYSTLAKYRLTVGGAVSEIAAPSSGTPQATSGVITGSGNISVVGQVFDARGFSSSVTQTIQVYPYSQPYLTDLVCERSTSSGAAADDGTYLHIKATLHFSSVSVNGTEKNTVQLKYAYLLSNGSWSAKTSISGTGGKYEATFGGIVSDVTKTYTIRITPYDAYGAAEPYVVQIPTKHVTFHLKNGGDGAAFGKYATLSNTLESDYKGKFNNGLDVTNGFTVGGKTLLNAIYPVGSIYLSVSSTNPQTLFGGTWQRIQDRFLLAAGSSYAAGATGGEASHTLTRAEMPSHRHRLVIANTSSSASNKKRVLTYIDATARWWNAGDGYDDSDMMETSGSGAAHNNMPPYLAVYVWKRTA